ncbi:oxidoreductase [Xylariaceae sp. FL0594]|nr:oxidoreductase [Xylariaceae sp. FL0594]
MASRVTYDFVIIGGGTSGLVVAARLSENPAYNVLVLETGSDHSADPRVQIPALFETLKGTDLDWDFKSTPQAALGGRTIDLNQGKALGGSSAINAFVFVPPTKALIDSWEALGNEGWNWDSLQPYFSKAYTCPPAVDAQTAKQLGIGKWTATNTDATGPLQTSFPAEFTHPTSAGAFSCLATIHPETKERSYSVSAYYKPIKDRANLHVLTNAQVMKILFDETEDGGGEIRATGVQYTHQGTASVVQASKEVILAADALQSPKILELSGVGDAKLLRGLGIDVILDLPAVGENLQDHTVSIICFEVNDGVETLDALLRQEPDTLAQAMRDYGTSRTGRMAHVGVTSYAYLPVRSSDGRDAIKRALAAYHTPGESGLSSARERAYFEITEKALLEGTDATAAYLTVASQTPQSAARFSELSGRPLPDNYLNIGAMLSHPLSRGTVHIRSGDYTAQPEIDPGYLTNAVDVEVLAQHVLDIEANIANAPLFREKVLKATPTHRHDPLASAEEAKAYLRENAIGMWHLGCTCAMLPRDKGGVVAPDLKVYGIKNLRVVDASALPTISTANLQATVYAFAERATDIAKGAWEM